MLKKTILFFTLWTLSHAYISRMAITRMRAPVAFRPGVVLPRPVYPPRMVSPAMRRAPFVLYRSPPHRYAMKHINTSPSRHLYSPWKTTRIPIPVSTPEYEFARAAPSSPIIHPDGAIHTIPAPNLSLSEKPIIVADAAENTGLHEPTEGPKPTYEVTEKYADQPNYQVNPKIETPIGFSKASSMSAADLQNIVRHNAALQLASEYGFPAIQLSQPTVQLPSTFIPQQFTMQGFHGLTNPHEFMHRGPEQIIIQPNGLYQPDPMFLQKLQSQILQQYPVEFVPYTPSTQHEVQTQPPETQTSLYLLQNEQLTKEEPIEHKEDNKNIVQRETQENAVSSIIPHAFSSKNVSENLIDIDISTVPQNITELLETEAPTTTVISIENPEDHKTTPIYYAQIGQSVGNVIANGFYSAINDVRASIEENHTNKFKLEENITTTTVPTTTQREIKSLFQNNIKKDSRVEDFTNLLGSPFEKTAESVNVAYTILRANEKEPKVNKDGEVFAGQVVEAKISEDQEFNKEKANLASRPPLRLYAVTEKVSEAPPQRTIVKARIPPKSKLIFDDKTGEPVLRVYASYLENSAQKELLTAKLSNLKYKEASRKQDNVDIKDLEKTLIGDVNHAQFGLKLKSRSDDYIPIFDEYDD